MRRRRIPRLLLDWGLTEMTPTAVLYEIASRDPDNGEKMPTEEDYKIFDAWVEETFGIDALVDYSTTNWRKVSDV